MTFKDLQNSLTNQRHRLHRHGDRPLNKVIHIIARSRMTYEGTTISYVDRRNAEDKTFREILRCVNGFIA